MLYYLLTMAASLAITVMLFKYSPRFIRSLRLKRQVLSTALIVLIAVIVSPAYFRYEPGTIWENGKIVEFNEKGFRWNIDNKEFFFPENPQVYVAGYVSALTPNPKIHRVKIELIGSISDPEKFYSYPEHRKLREGRLVHAHNNGDKYPEYSPTTDFEALGDWYLEDQIGKIISYYTIEFTNQNSNQLSEFLNPLEEEHQRQVGLLTESWINPRMEWIGLKVKYRRFVLQ